MIYIYNIGLPLFILPKLPTYVVKSHKYVFVKFVNSSWEKLYMFRLWKIMIYDIIYAKIFMKLEIILSIFVCWILACRSHKSCFRHLKMSTTIQVKKHLCNNATKNFKRKLSVHQECTNQCQFGCRISKLVGQKSNIIVQEST